jgi:alpha-D-xyloside xylohydrolase
MVCPVYKYEAREREVYFPENEGWYNFYTGEFTEGGQSKVVDAPYERIPLFVPAGAIIPAGPEIEHTTQKKPELITLYVYTGADGEFGLYEDEGTNYDYEKGQFATIPFTYNHNNQTLTIGKREGSFDGMLKERRFKVVFVSSKHPVGFDPENADGQMVKYSGEAIEVAFDKP